LLITVAFYFLPFAVGIAAVPDISKWTDGSWTAIASAVGGQWLALLVAGGAVLSVIGMCNATLLSASRLPLVMAEDKYLPKQLSALHPKYGTPWVGIVISAAFAACLAAKGFKELVKIDVLIYSAGLLLEFAALVVLRYKRPELARRYRIPGGRPVVWLLVLVPTALIVAAFVITLRDDLDATNITVGALLSGPIVYGLAKLAKRKPKTI
jgi:amino acid transporter